MPVKTVGGVTTGSRDMKAETLEEAAAKAEGERAVRFQREETEKEKLAAQGDRTDEESTGQHPLKVILGGKDFEIPLLSWNKNKVWRARYREHMKGTCKLRDLRAKFDKPEDISFDALVVTETNTVDDEAELLVLYLELSGTANASILDEATQPEVNAAFKEVEKVASPFV